MVTSSPPAGTAAAGSSTATTHAGGLTTLRRDHVRIEGPDAFMFEFRAKSGKEQRVRLADPRLAGVVHACHELPGDELFGYVGDAFRRAEDRDRLSYAESATLLLVAGDSRSPPT
jgi:DNA topoisomerase IB